MVAQLKKGHLVLEVRLDGFKEEASELYRAEKGLIRHGIGRTYLKADHKIDVVDGLVVFEELHGENVGDQAIDRDHDPVKRQKPTMDYPITVLLADEPLGSLGQQPVEHPDGQHYQKGHHLVYVDSVTQDDGQDQELEYFLLALVVEVL